ncbi:hypothetical protein OHS59_26590 [Streptomyces sp. NBC_00414]|uniref:hypothetical protein n=1 Tax=Streptomyces sp. NBC_00414 TaxID=2975739 RepID=UPI002E1D7949
MAAEDALMRRVDSLIGSGHMGREKAVEVEDAFPEARARILGRLRLSSQAGDWRRFEPQAGVAVHLHPEGLAAILAPVLAPRAQGVNSEDLVDMLGELRAPEGVEPISSLVRERKDTDGPFYALCIKGVQALAGIGTPEALRFLGDIARTAPGKWPDPLRWHAAQELGIEDELGFDEDAMLGGA